MNWTQRLLAASQFAKQQAKNLYNNAPITQAVKQRSFQPLVTAIGNNSMSFMGTAGAKRLKKDPFIPGSNYVRQSWVPDIEAFQKQVDRSLAQDALRRRYFQTMQGFQKATSNYSPEKLISNFIRRK